MGFFESRKKEEPEKQSLRLGGEKKNVLKEGKEEFFWKIHRSA